MKIKIICLQTMNEIEILKRFSQVKNSFILSYYDYSYDEKKKNILLVFEYGECSIQEIMNEFKLGKDKWILEPTHFLYII